MEPETAKKFLTLEDLYSVHHRCQELLSAKNNIRFDKLVSFAIEVGFKGKYASGGSSHWVGRHPEYELCPPAYDKVNFQKMRGNKAKPYQVEQLVDFIQEATPKRGKT